MDRRGATRPAGDRTAVVWFRRDLRLADNPALAAALADHDRVVGLFVHDPALLGPAGANRVAFLHATLDALQADLDGLLVERAGDPVRVVPALAAEVEADAVFVAEDFGPAGTGRDAAVEDALVDAGRTLERVGSPYAVPPGTVFTKGGGPFRVFTPYSRAWRAHGWADPIPAPRSARWLTGVDGAAGSGGSQRPRTPAPTATDGLPEAGERAAHAALERFLADHVDAYADERDRPDRPGTSRLSPHLKVGAVHPRQLLAGIEGRHGRGPDTWRIELCWRDFYADVLFHRPDSARRNYVDTLDGLRWDTGAEADERFAAWQAGRTGYPIVDAGMRQLLAEGWMHNRVRMIVASFLVKDLHLDWRLGARHFLDHLVDGDLASNQHGWQWTAGTGTDAAPFFRVFNPVAQGKRFDPDGDYVRRYVPELRHVAGPKVHEPGGAAASSAARGAPADLFGAVDEVAGGDYPAPIVDHAVERAEALARFKAR